MDKQKIIHLNLDLVINKAFFEPMVKELTCLICKGLLVDPILCSECESPFCTSCITIWKLRNNNCINKCKGPFQIKQITKMMKDIMNKVLLNCNICKSEISLNSYPSHIISCEDNSKLINCPFCKECKLKNSDLKLNEIDLTKYPKLNQTLLRNDQEVQKHNKKLQEANNEIAKENEKFKLLNNELKLKISKISYNIIY